MTTIQSTLSPYLLPASSLLGVLGLSGGIYGLLNPLAFSETLGVALPTGESRETAAALPFVSFVAARNAGTGISIIALAALGYKRALGMCLMAGTTTALADAWVCSKYGAKDEKTYGHAFMAVVIGAVGAGLYNP